MPRELDVRAARLDADRADDGRRRVAELLVGLVGERHLRRDGDRVARVDAHRVEVLDRADDHDVVRAVADHLELELVPAPDRLLDEHLADRALGEAALDLAVERVEILGEAAAVPAERERRAHDGRDRRQGEIVDRFDDHGVRHLEAAALHRVAEELPILGPLDHVDARAEQLDPELLEHAGGRELDREVERRLAAERRQEAVGPLAAEDVGDPLEVERLDVRPVGEPGVGHDRRRVRVDDDRAVAVLPQHLERLAAGVVELAGLTDHDRPGADHADRLEIAPSGHRSSIATQRSRIGQASCGPGPASGWNCTEEARSAGKSKPSTVPS